MDVLEGVVESGTATSLTDTVNLVQNDGYFGGGTLWFLSGANGGKIKIVSAHKFNILNWTGNLTAPSAGDRFAVCRRLLPYRQIRQAINAAFEVPGSYIKKENATIVANGSTSYTLPAGVANIREVWLVPSSGSPRPDYHHQERGGKIWFNYAPSGVTLSLLYRAQHDELVADTDAINSEINLEWLKWKAIEIGLRWQFRELRNDPQLNTAVFLNEARENLKTLRPRLTVDIDANLGG